MSWLCKNTSITMLERGERENENENEEGEESHGQRLHSDWSAKSFDGKLSTPSLLEPVKLHYL